MLFLLATLIFLALMAAALAAAAAIAWHLLTYRLKGDLGAWLALAFIIGVVVFATIAGILFFAVPWDELVLQP